MRIRPLALALATMMAGPACAASEEVQALLAEMTRLAQRVEALEKHNRELERSLASERISENEPEIVTRLKAVETQSLNMQKPARMVEALDGISAGFSLTTVAQSPSSALRKPGTDLDGKFGASQLNYRGDAFVTLPLDPIGDVESKVFAHFRFGQGFGLNELYSYSKPNASAFRVTSLNPDDSVAILGQAWYQATLPLPLGGFKPHSRETLEINFGKLDPFAFFDQNAAANDETRQFLNTVFVHNPLLDAGGDIAVDANGFTPGMRVSYQNRTDKREAWRLSLGVFGAGRGANYTRFFSSPLIFAQAETQQRVLGGLLGNYRAYYWRSGQAPSFDGGTNQRTGWGLSADQRIGDATTAFARYGQHIAGTGARFNRALTAGFEMAGTDWHRGGDALGVAAGWLRSADAFRTASATVDANGNGIPDYGYAAGASERLAEIYYRWRVNKQFELSPSLQVIANPGADPGTRSYRVASLRAQLSY